MRFGAVICAAGGGTRMGQNKALCRISDDETFLSSIVSSIRSVAMTAPVAVVIGAQAEEVRARHRFLSQQTPLVWVENASWATTHMLDSLMLGISAIPKNHAILHWPVDCIGILPADIIRLLNAEDSPFAVLSFHGIPGHPLRISASKSDWLRDHASSFDSLKSVIRGDRRVFVESDTHALMNCNDPQKLGRFRLEYAKEKESR